MNRNEQQMYKDISNLTKAVQKLVKLMEKIADKPRKLLKDGGPVLTKQANKVKYV